MFDNLFKLHSSFRMFKSLLLKEDGDGAFRMSTGKEFQRTFEVDSEVHSEVDSKVEDDDYEDDDGEL